MKALFVLLLLCFSLHGDIQEIAEEAYIYAYPMLQNYKALSDQIKQDGGADKYFNRFHHVRQLITPAFTTVVRPNNDTLYSFLTLDLREEPFIIIVPEVKNRYFSFQLIDLFTYNIGYIGSRTTGQGPGKYMIVGPNWNGNEPAGIDKVFRSDTDLLLVLGRTEVIGPDDVAIVQMIQNQYKAVPLSTFIKELPPAPAATLAFPSYDSKQATNHGFIEYFNFLLGLVKIDPSEQELMAQFKELGIGPNVAYNENQYSSETKEAIDEGIANALRKIQAEVPKLGKNVNNWILTMDAFGSPEEMKGKYLTRAAAAMMGLYGNDVAEAYYPATFKDVQGVSLNGTEGKYQIHFTKEAIPPVKAFWSLTLYGMPSQLLVTNPINRYSIGDRSKSLQYNEDGSLTLYIQAESPGSEKETNWLPSPRGPFTLQMRLYWPTTEALGKPYAPPPVSKGS